MTKSKRAVGRPNELGDSKLVAVRLPVSLVRELQALADRQNDSISSVVRQILENHVS